MGETEEGRLARHRSDAFQSAWSRISASLALVLAAMGGCSSDDRPPSDGGPVPDPPRDSGPQVPTDAAAEAAPPSDGTIIVNRPELVPATDARIATLRAPAGFEVSVVMRGLINPRMLAVGADGSLYVTSPALSQVWRLYDINADGDTNDADEQTIVASTADFPDLAGVHGIAIAGIDVYLASVKAVFVATLSEGRFVGLRKIVGDLPDGGQHPNRTLAVGPDGKLYVSIGSDCNACAETNTEHASILRLELDGTPAQNPSQVAHPVVARTPTAMVSPRIFASGLRNTLGFDWHPATGQLWGSDHGSDGRGNDVPAEELNRLIGGAAYGWPYCWGDRQVDAVIDDPSMNVSKESYCQLTEPFAIGYQAHSAPIAFIFYRGYQFPAEYRGDALAVFRGSWNRATATGFKVVRIHFDEGEPAPAGSAMDPVEDFLSGFLIDNDHQFGRIAGLATDLDGSLLVSEDANGVIYRVAYTGKP
jgi:glucose/arabinose dehydrogenase